MMASLREEKIKLNPADFDDADGIFWLLEMVLIFQSGNSGKILGLSGIVTSSTVQAWDMKLESQLGGVQLY